MMTKLTLRGIWSHKHRFIGAFTAVFLSVAFLAGTLIVSDTLSRSIDQFFQQAYHSTDVVVRNATQVSDGPVAPRGTIPVSALESVASVPGVAVAEPVIQGSGQLLDKDGNIIETRGPRQASNWIDNPSLNPYHVVEGRAPRKSGEVVIDRQIARNAHLQIGDTTVVLTPQRVEVTIVGIVKFGLADAYGGGSFVGMTLADAQRYLVPSPDRITSISVKAAPGVSPDVLRQQIQSVLPSNTEAITGKTLIQENFDSVDQGFLRLFRTFLVSFAGVALVVSLFSMYNTFSIIVAQRTRESAMLRAIGASRRQVLASVLVEGLVVGVGASGIGFAGGIGVATLLGRAFKAGLGIPVNGLSVTTIAAIISIGTGVVVTLLASLRPALQASRTPPIAVLRDATLEPTTSRRAGVIAGSLVLAFGAGLIVIAAKLGSANASLLLVGAGAIASLVGIIALNPRMANPVSALLGAPGARIRGIPGQLARRNAMRSPRRTARAATALFLGVGVVTIFTILVASLSAGLRDSLNTSLKNDLVISTGDLPTLGFSPRLAETVATLAPVERATGIGTGPALIDGSSSTISAVDPNQLGSLIDLSVTSGSLAELRANRLAVSTTTAQDNGWTVGTMVPVTFADGAKQDFTVVALYKPNSVLKDYLIPFTTWMAHDAQPRDTLLLITLKPGVTLAEGRAAVARATQRIGAPPVQTRTEFTATQTSVYGTILNVAYGLLAFAIVIALMGIGNTLSLSTYERTRELGLLRAVGASQGQLRSMVRWESVIVAVFGTLCGVLIGLFIGWGMATAIAKRGASEFTLPVIQLILILIIGALAGVLAAIRPAGRAAKLNVLDAIASE